MTECVFWARQFSRKATWRCPGLFLTRIMRKKHTRTQLLTMPPTREELSHLEYRPDTGLIHFRDSGLVYSPSQQIKYNRLEIAARTWRRWQIAFVLMNMEIPDRVKYRDGNHRNNSWDNLQPIYDGRSWRLLSENIRLGHASFKVQGQLVQVARYHVYICDASRQVLVNQPFYNLAYAMIFRDKLRVD